MFHNFSFSCVWAMNDITIYINYLNVNAQKNHRLKDIDLITTQSAQDDVKIL